MRLLRWHRVAAWIGGAQLLVWIFTGLAFSWFDFGAVRGTGDRLPPPPLDVGATLPLSPRDALDRANRDYRRAGQFGGWLPSSITLQRAGDRMVYVLREADQELAIDAQFGGRVQIDAVAATAIARDGHRTHPPLRTPATEATDGDDVPLPAWRVPLGDARRTDVYVSARTGEILAWRTATYRRFDFLWSLHTLGYVNRDMPSHPTMRVVTALAALIALTGVLLLVRRLRRRPRRAASAGADARP